MTLLYLLFIFTHFAPVVVAGVVHENLAGVFATPAMILADEMLDTGTQIKIGSTWGIIIVIVGGLSTIVGLIAGIAMIIDRVKGVDRVTKIENDPMTVVEGETLVKHSELRLTMMGFVGKDDLRRVEAGLEGRIDERFESLDQRRRIDIAELHKKIELKAEESRANLADEARELRGQINETPGRVIDLLQKTGAIGGKKS